MATFSDLRRIQEDTIRVDMKQRWTPQIVKFVNDKNEFYGLFRGKIDVISGSIANASLSNTQFYNERGEKVDLSAVLAVEERVVDLEQNVQDLSTTVWETVPSWISASTSSGLSSLSVILEPRITKNEKDIKDIYHRLSGMINYMGSLTLNKDYSSDTIHSGFAQLFYENSHLYEENLSNGWIYQIVSTVEPIDNHKVDGIKLGHGDYIKVNKNTTVNSITSNDVIIVDGLDSDVVHIDLLNSISTHLSDDLITERQRINTLINRVDDNDSDIEMLSTALFIAPNKYGNPGLSGKVDFLLSSGIESMEYAGELSSNGGTYWDYKLKQFIAQGHDSKYGDFLKQGKLYRIACNTPFLSDDTGNTVVFNINDYFFIKNACILSNITVNNLAIIRDAYEEAISVQTWINNNFLHLSGGDYVQNTEYFNIISATDVSIVNDYVTNIHTSNLSVNNKNILSTIHDDIENKVDSLSISNVDLTGSLVLSSLSQESGKIKFGTRNLISSDILYLSNYVQNEIKLSVEDLHVDNTITGKVILTSLSEDDGKISYGTDNITSSDILYLSNYVQNEIKLSVEDLSINQGKTDEFILSIHQENGKITEIRTSKVTDDYIENESISQVKIQDLSTDLKNISSDLSGVRNDFYDTFDTTELSTGLKLKLTDNKYDSGTGKQKKYKLCFRSGTIVLDEII